MHSRGHNGTHGEALACGCPPTQSSKADSRREGALKTPSAEASDAVLAEAFRDLGGPVYGLRALVTILDATVSELVGYPDASLPVRVTETDAQAIRCAVRFASNAAHDLYEKYFAALDSEESAQA